MSENSKCENIWLFQHHRKLQPRNHNHMSYIFGLANLCHKTSLSYFKYLLLNKFTGPELDKNKASSSHSYTHIVYLPVWRRRELKKPWATWSHFVQLKKHIFTKLEGLHTYSPLKSKLNPDLGHQQSVSSLFAVAFSDEPLEVVSPLFQHHTLCLEIKKIVMFCIFAENKA